MKRKQSQARSMSGAVTICDKSGKVILHRVAGPRGFTKKEKREIAAARLLAAGLPARRDNPSQIARVQARGGKRFVVATHSEESDNALLNRVNAVRVIKRVNTNGIVEAAAGLQALEYLGGKVAPKRRRNAAPSEWDDEEFTDEELNEASRQGWLGATAMRREHAKRAVGPKFFNVTWYSSLKRKRVGFIRPIEAHTAAQAKAEAKAMVENDPKTSNFIAKEVIFPVRNPSNFDAEIKALLKEQVNIKRRFGTPWESQADHRRLAQIKNRLKTLRWAKREARRANPEYEVEATPKVKGKTIRVKALTHGGAVRKARRQLGPHKKAYDLSVQRVNPSKPKVMISKSDSGRWVVIISDGGPVNYRAEFETKKEALAYAREKKQLRNPSTREMSERFVGEANGEYREMYGANGAPGDASRGGKFVFLKLTDRRSQLRIPGAAVIIDPNRERLWIVGNRTPLMNRKAKPGERLDCGEIDVICYEVAKKHIGKGKTFEYVHPFGEDGGRKPHLHIDAEGMPLIVGGDYKIRKEGIVN